jgi:hypothetical protein
LWVSVQRCLVCSAITYGIESVADVR